LAGAERARGGGRLLGQGVLGDVRSRVEDDRAWDDGAGRRTAGGRRLGTRTEVGAVDAGGRKQALALSGTARGRIGGAAGLRDKAYPRWARMMQREEGVGMNLGTWSGSQMR
jgi:hypothetical protein